MLINKQKGRPLNMNKKELLQLNVQLMNFYYKLNDEDKKTFKKDYHDIDKIFEKMYNKFIISDEALDNYLDFTK